ncbi:MULTISPECIES: AAA family ATPase [unclassified Microcystis]|uniref:ATP-binding protein n=1 Tax=Microcystis flos-aquae Mf_QC_C_20070823_S10D TaxID=2486236 RepID=A0A552KKB7_9CHRO|nr:MULTISPECIES: AAA family ATPase [unclassified Microcystis]MCA2818659.1 AAA family ATPase [Microcystis sp. M085S1]MCA2857674.1 AAA family ATPase [Microcystis sp. M065S1]TRT75752.1 MAG: ATP-binding protein [Microcystis flos-aquae Ma_QC_C_20070823_S18]TRT94939.1 MAG: ATP-binding protein [Microcystis flos-aquae Ma_QC_C_20070823_S18D]TRV08417.1 MAG: ATP-binding protein [Microcystis flos-aquae Mf_QC_C_20070823_S10D]TRV19157.1 MAG: ATP-binding protein [Microcystis flos-aquae Mf_QC_C_20070823_S10]
MELLIKNLGSIRNNNQAIDLTKKFYTFIGYNNSGKTLVSQLLWTIFNHDNIRKFSENNQIDSLVIDSEKPIKKITINQELIGEILNKFSRFIEKEVVNTYNLDASIKETIISSNKLIFQADIKEFKDKSFRLTFVVDNDLEYLQISKEQGSLTINIKELNIPEKVFDQIPRDLFERAKPYKESVIIPSIIRVLLSPIQDTFFIPASRSFFPVFYQYIYEIERNKRSEYNRRLQELIENIDDDVDTNRDIFKRLQEQLPKRSYTEPMNKVIESLYSLNTNKKINSVYNSLIEKMIGLMGGEITISSLELIAPIQFSFKFDESKDLPMYLASSSVNQLTILYLYLKYWAKEKNNFLMIDEPEVNLHPENQIRLMDILVQFVTEHNNRVLITTHSPILTDILNNYVYLHTLKSYDVDVTKIIEDNQLKNLNPEISIAKEDLGVYFFTGDKIIDYGTSQYGVYFRNFTEVINSVQKSGEILTNHIYLAENE